MLALLSVPRANRLSSQPAGEVISHPSSPLPTNGPPFIFQPGPGAVLPALLISASLALSLHLLDLLDIPVGLGMGKTHLVQFFNCVFLNEESGLKG